MYLAEPPKESDLDAYFEKYAPVVKAKFQELLAGRVIIISVRNSEEKLKVRLGKDSAASKLIEKYCEDNNLRRLLCGDLNELLDIFDEIKGIDDKAGIQISKKKHKLKGKGRDFEIEDDLNAIFHTVLVEEIYEDTDVFDKKTLVYTKNLSICPYCGISNVIGYKSSKIVTLGYETEHYLPKSKFPYFAISFHNLFPACKECNGIGAKGTNSPLEDDDRTQCLMHPYMFENDAMHFDVRYDGNGDFNDDNFDILIDYHGNRHLSKGYNEVIPIENRYKTEKAEARIIWNGIKSRNEDYSRFVEPYGIEREDYIKSTNVLNFEESIENSRTIRMYKFKTEMLHKLLQFHK